MKWLDASSLSVCLVLFAFGCATGDPGPRDAGRARVDGGPSMDAHTPAVDGGGSEWVDAPALDAARTDGGRDCDDTLCGVDCVDLDTDVNHCGDCDTVCPGGSHCASGSCACDTGRTDCDGVCADLGWSAANCGACGVACAAGQECFEGTCGPSTCAPGTTRCGAACIDTQSSDANCGACDHRCASTEACMAGACVDTCPAPGMRCSTGGSVSCVDTSSDRNNCGVCGVTCSAIQACVGGTCTCTAPGAMCGGTCVNTSTDTANCGGCGVECAPSQTCTGGVCVCTSGRTLCSGSCVDTNADPSNCGSCGRACAASQTCTAGACVCTSGRTLCSGACVDTNADPANCGGCGRACSAGSSCSAGSCTTTAPVNDNRTSATTITLGAAEITVSGSTTNATNDGPATTCSGSGDPNVWYRFTLARRAVVYFDTAGSSYDTKLYMTDSSGTLLSGTTFCNDDAGCGTNGGFTSGLQSRIYGLLAAGTYYVGVGGFSSGSRGNFTLHGQMIPDNVGSFFYSDALAGGSTTSTVLVGTSVSEGSCMIGRSGEDVRWFVTCGAPQSFSLCSAEGGSWTRQSGSNTYDPSMYIRSGQTGGEVACNDDTTSCPGRGGDTLSWGSRLTNVDVPRGIAVHFVDERTQTSGLTYTLAYTVRNTP